MKLAAKLGAGAAAFTMIGFLITWTVGAEDKIQWKKEAEEQHEDIETQHDKDIKAMLKQNRIQTNRIQLINSKRILVGERYRNEAEKQLIISQILALETALRCDEQGICN